MQMSRALEERHIKTKNAEQTELYLNETECRLSEKQMAEYLFLLCVNI